LYEMIHFVRSSYTCQLADAPTSSFKTTHLDTAYERPEHSPCNASSAVPIGLQPTLE